MVKMKYWGHAPNLVLAKILQKDAAKKYKYAVIVPGGGKRKGYNIKIGGGKR